MSPEEFFGPVGTKWPEAEAEQNLPPEGVHISDGLDSSQDPRPVRSLESHGVIDQVEGAEADRLMACDHHMVSIKTNSDRVKYVERCQKCGWIDGFSLNWWAENAIKEQMAARAQRIAITVESKPFAFTQSTTEELPIEEVLFQALGAASMCWDPRPYSQVFDSTRAREIGEALLDEVRRYLRLEREDAATRAVEYISRNNAHTSTEQYHIALRRAIEGKP